MAADRLPSSPSEMTDNQDFAPETAGSSSASLKTPPATGSSPPWLSTDPRATSVQSLSPSVGPSHGQRRLLVVYIHGFQGTDTSFKWFPYHVHQYLNLFLDSHVIHTKVYPRYKTYKSLEVARDRFSAWLSPHESEDTDVILVGHSMGGLLAAEVALIPDRSPYRRQPYKHRILGTVSLDAPLLGLHPGIIGAGLSSLFRKPEQKPPKDESGLSSPQDLTPLSSYQSEEVVFSETSSGEVASMDPTYNPTFFNDVNFAQRPFAERLMNFWSKHSREGIVPAFRNHFMSHLEFGSCLVDFAGLNMRYDRIRALEDYDEMAAPSPASNQASAPAKVRIRFVNYYTVSNGIKSQQSESRTRDSPVLGTPTEDSQALVSPRPQQSPLPRISISDPAISSISEALAPPLAAEEEREAEGTEKKKGAKEENEADQEKEAEEEEESEEEKVTEEEREAEEERVTEKERVVEGEEDSEEEKTAEEKKGAEEKGAEEKGADDGGHESDHTIIKLTATVPELPAIPDIPPPPLLRDLMTFTDKHERRQVEKEDKNAVKAYHQALKERDKVIKKRDKIMEAHQKQLEKEAAKEAKLQKKKQEQKKQQQEKQQQERPDDSELLEALRTEAAKLQLQEEGVSHPMEGAVTGLGKLGTSSTLENQPREKERKFCTLPRKTRGVRDKTWVPVRMGDMDEVTAHSAIFLQGPHYESLVVQMGSRLVEWVHEDLSRRAIQQMIWEDAELAEAQP